MEAFQLWAITAQFTLATLYVAPLQHLINTMRNRESHLCLLAAERPSLSQAESGSTTVSDGVGNMQRPHRIAICSFIKSSHRACFSAKDQITLRCNISSTWSQCGLHGKLKKNHLTTSEKLKITIALIDLMWNRYAYAVQQGEVFLNCFAQ